MLRDVYNQSFNRCNFFGIMYVTGTFSEEDSLFFDQLQSDDDEVST